MKKLSKGINDEISNEDYHADKRYLSSSNLKLILKDTEQFHKEVILGEKNRKHINAFDEGSYAHSLILEPHMIEKEYRFFKGFVKRGKEWEAFKEANKGFTILSFPQQKRVEKWVQGYRELPAAVNLIKGGVAEHTVTGTIEGVDLKARADYINIEEGYIADVKTTAFDVDVDSFKDTIKNYSYDLSAALYCKLMSMHYGKPFEFYFIVLGKKDSECQVYKLSEDSMGKGDSLVRNAIRLYKKCKETDNWSEDVKAKREISPDDYEILEV